ncbi:hypothetical protein EC988_004847, partial [Linderina pennispora]
MIQPVARHMSTEQPPAKDRRKKTPRSKYMGVRPESPAIVRMADSFAESAPSFDIVAELDAFRFSSEDLIRQLPAVRTQLASDASVSISPAELAATNRKETLDLLNELRVDRAEKIKGAFRVDQLKEYLERHGKPVSGSKGKLVNRIITDVWGISPTALELKLNKPKEEAVQDGIDLPLSSASLEAVRKLEDDVFAQLEREFNVRIVLGQDKLRVTGVMHNVRAALSVLRERIVAKATVQVKLEKYGRPRGVSEQHAQAIVGKIGRQANGKVTVSEGEYFVTSDSPADAVDLQHALVKAMVEAKHQTVLVVAADEIKDALACTAIPAADPVGLPSSSVLDQALFAQMPSEIIAPVVALARHTLYEISAQGKVTAHTKNLVSALQDWVNMQEPAPGQSICLKTRLGKAMFDSDSESASLMGTLLRPHQLVDAVAGQKPQFGFSTNAPPLRWLEGPAAFTQTQLVLRLKSVQNTTSQGLPRLVPVYGSDSVTVRIPVAHSKLQMEDAGIERTSSERHATVAVLGSLQDFQVTVGSRQTIETAPQAAEVVSGLLHRLGLSGPRDPHRTPHRHEVVEIAGAMYGLQAVELVDVTHRHFSSGFSARVHKTWDMVDDLKFSEVEFLPTHDVHDIALMSQFLNSSESWEKFLLLVFQAAMERPSSA